MIIAHFSLANFMLTYLLSILLLLTALFVMHNVRGVRGKVYSMKLLTQCWQGTLSYNEQDAGDSHYITSGGDKMPLLTVILNLF